MSCKLYHINSLFIPDVNTARTYLSAISTKDLAGHTAVSPPTYVERDVAGSSIVLQCILV